MIPWFLYNLTARDQGSPLIRPYHEYQEITVANPVDIALAVFPGLADSCILVTSINVTGNPSGANTPDRLEYRVQDNTTPVVQEHYYGVYHPEFGAAGNARGHTWEGAPIQMIMPLQQILCKVTLNGASAAPWTMQASVSGVIIPRGTLALT